MIPQKPTPPQQAPTTGPTAVWLAAGFLLAGLGTALLGPILPTLAAQWNLTDNQSGILIFFKFTGAFVGGALVPRRLRLGILCGTLLCAAGIAAFALVTGLHADPLTALVTASFALAVSGFGLGQIIASTNILAGLRYRAHTGSALALLNFFWAFGAVATGLLAGALLPHYSLRGPLLSFAALFVVVGLGGLLNTATEPATKQPTETHSLSRATFLQFAFLLFLYGGLETCLTVWLPTFTIRFSDAQLLGGQSATVLLWLALTAGRALSSAALRYVTEATLQRASLAVSAALIATFSFLQHAPALSLICILLGLSLSPFFPATFALLMKRLPPTRTAGFILAVSGLGAALFPYLMGVISTHTGSLRTAMAIPFLLALTMFAISFKQQQT